MAKANLERLRQKAERSIPMCPCCQEAGFIYEHMERSGRFYCEACGHTFLERDVRTAIGQHLMDLEDNDAFIGDLRATLATLTARRNKAAYAELKRRFDGEKAKAKKPRKKG